MWLQKFYEASKDSGAITEFVIMEGYGHEFPGEYYDELLNWMKRNLSQQDIPNNQ